MNIQIIGVRTAGPTPSPSPAVKLVAIVNGAEVSAVNSVVRIPPSVLPPVIGSKCSSEALAYAPQSASIILKCVSLSSGLPVAGCKYSVQLSEGTFNGGHSHGARPLICRPTECDSIPNLLVSGQSGSVDQIGTLLNYASPEISGTVNLTFAGTDPDGKPIRLTELPPKLSFHVQASGSETADGQFAWSPLSNEYLDVIVNGVDSDASHENGYYGVPDLAGALASAGEAFFTRVSAFQEPPRLKSEAGSLPWGGLYDINKDWHSPHCGHRDGRTVDLSMSAVPTAILKSALRSSVIKSGLDFFFVEESPDNASANHWHVSLK